jgi:hypothetical protein
MPSTPMAMAPLTSLPAKISPGTYVAFAVATSVLANDFDQDSDTYHLISGFERNRYLGLVSDSFSYTTVEGEVVNEIKIYHVSRWFPSVFEHHYIPIYPYTDVGADPREPLRTKTLFPYANCKQWTALSVTLTVDIVHESTLSFLLSDEDLVRFDECAVVDYNEQRWIKAPQPGLGGNELVTLDLATHALPGEIWMDIRVGNQYSDPTEFTEEINDLEM